METTILIVIVRLPIHASIRGLNPLYNVRLFRINTRWLASNDSNAGSSRSQWKTPYRCTFARKNRFVVLSCVASRLRVANRPGLSLE